MVRDPLRDLLSLSDHLDRLDGLAERDGEGLDRHRHRIERGQGPFERRFVFAEPIDVERIAAEFHDGVLAITLPKPAARRITVR